MSACGSGDASEPLDPDVTAGASCATASDDDVLSSSEQPTTRATATSGLASDAHRMLRAMTLLDGSGGGSISHRNLQVTLRDAGRVVCVLSLDPEGVE